MRKRVAVAHIINTFVNSFTHLCLRVRVNLIFCPQQYCFLLVDTITAVVSPWSKLEIYFVFLRLTSEFILRPSYAHSPFNS